MRGVDGNFNISFSVNSITVGNEWGGVFGDLKILNRGISGDISAGVIKSVSEITERKPGEFFLMIGINDLAKGIFIGSLEKKSLNKGWNDVLIKCPAGGLMEKIGRTR